jgi:hypothetical protein
MYDSPIGFLTQQKERAATSAVKESGDSRLFLTSYPTTLIIKADAA